MTALPAGLTVDTIGPYTQIRHDGTGRWLPLRFGNEERLLLPLVAPHLQGVDWTVNPDELTDTKRDAWMANARAATQAARKAIEPILTKWDYARDEAAWEACDERGLCRICAEPYGDDMAAMETHYSSSCGGEGLDAEMIEAKLGLTPAPLVIPEPAS